MKLTNAQLKQIIQEELQGVLEESWWKRSKKAPAGEAELEKLLMVDKLIFMLRTARRNKDDFTEEMIKELAESSNVSWEEMEEIAFPTKFRGHKTADNADFREEPYGEWGKEKDIKFFADPSNLLNTRWGDFGQHSRPGRYAYEQQKQNELSQAFISQPEKLRRLFALDQAANLLVAGEQDKAIKVMNQNNLHYKEVNLAARSRGYSGWDLGSYHHSPEDGGRGSSRSDYPFLSEHLGRIIMEELQGVYVKPGWEPEEDEYEKEIRQMFADDPEALKKFKELIAGTDDELAASMGQANYPEIDPDKEETKFGVMSGTHGDVPWKDLWDEMPFRGGYLKDGKSMEDVQEWLGTMAAIARKYPTNPDIFYNDDRTGLEVDNLALRTSREGGLVNLIWSEVITFNFKTIRLKISEAKDFIDKNSGLPEVVFAHARQQIKFFEDLERKLDRLKEWVGLQSDMFLKYFQDYKKASPNKPLKPAAIDNLRWGKHRKAPTVASKVPSGKEIDRIVEEEIAAVIGEADVYAPPGYEDGVTCEDLESIKGLFMTMKPELISTGFDLLETFPSITTAPGECGLEMFRFIEDKYQELLKLADEMREDELDSWSEAGKKFNDYIIYWQNHFPHRENSGIEAVLKENDSCMHDNLQGLLSTSNPDNWTVVSELAVSMVEEHPECVESYKSMLFDAIFDALDNAKALEMDLEIPRSREETAQLEAEMRAWKDAAESASSALSTLEGKSPNMVNEPASLDPMGDIPFQEGKIIAEAMNVDVINQFQQLLDDLGEEAVEILIDQVRIFKEGNIEARIEILKNGKLRADIYEKKEGGLRSLEQMSEEQNYDAKGLYYLLEFIKVWTEVLGEMSAPW